MKYSRHINILDDLKYRSLFLLGPRQTGKSSLLGELFKDGVTYNLLEADTFQELSADPTLVRTRLRSNDQVIVIDEIQKLPSLLDEVHLLIERHKELRFVLTGSSARKLRRGGTNLLAGRAWTRYLHPLVSVELGGGDSRLLDRVNRGSLPAIIDSPRAQDDLKSYVGTYLQEEIRAEGLARSIENFSRFLLVAGLSNGKQINFENIGQDVGISPRTIREYFHLLVDTLVGSLLEPFSRTLKRKAVGVPKFYLFDLGVANFLQRRGAIVRGSAAFGECLEHLVGLELRAFLDYSNLDLVLGYWRSTTKFEVDFTVGDELAVEVKAKARVTDQDLRGIRALKEEGIFKRYLVVTDERATRKTEDKIELIPVDAFLRRLWSGEFTSSSLNC